MLNSSVSKSVSSLILPLEDFKQVFRVALQGIAVRNPTHLNRPCENHYFYTNFRVKTTCNSFSVVVLWETWLLI